MYPEDPTLRRMFVPLVGYALPYEEWRTNELVEGGFGMLTGIQMEEYQLWRGGRRWRGSFESRTDGGYIYIGFISLCFAIRPEVVDVAGGEHFI